MLKIGLIREGKVPGDSRVALIPAQCKWLRKNFPDIKVIVQQSAIRCYSDKEYLAAGMEVKEDMSDCAILMGIKEVPVDMLLQGKTYLFFSHTKKLQPYNQNLIRAIVEKKITLIDYECLEHEDGTRIIGFGFFAGIVGAHNAMMAYGNRTGLYKLPRVNTVNSFQKLIHCYFGLKVPNIKIAVTGTGRVAHGVLEIMNLLGIHEVDADEYTAREFAYPVYVHLKGSDLYANKETGKYNRDDFHENPRNYVCRFERFIPFTDILINGVYWDKDVPRLFELEDMSKEAEEAAATLGASRRQTFLRVVLPVLLPALLTGFALALARAVGEYGSVIFIAGNIPFVSEIAPLLIIIRLTEFNYPAATAIATIMLAISFMLLLLINLLQAWSRKRLAHD